MNLQKIKEELASYLKNINLKLYDVNYLKKDSILQVILDEKLDLNQLEEISAKVSSFMDTVDSDMDQYLLDVTTVGVERPIRNAEEVKEAVGSYVFVKTKDMSLNGDLVKFENDVLTLSYKEKTRVKQKDINYKEVKQMRYAVKF